MSVNQSDYIYLHGFASGPRSAKAAFFRERFRELRRSIETPDLNGENFSTLTLTRQIERVGRERLASGSPVTLIGSSLGGLMAAWLAEKYVAVRGLVLLAPAFGFPRRPPTEEMEETLREWERSGWLSVYHYGYGRSLPIHYEFVRDAGIYREEDLTRPVPTLILHGRSDGVIPIERSREYARSRPHVQLIELDSDHALTDVLPRIWTETRNFLEL
ncbi:YqiA/YcfP family alpha/beta fold hydrolase [Pannus brasiliensis]|uniref:YqiA/YcfP family alpha/beta fold hydrolase n=1 Tax=Pannus brasiliensis TaxID=1579216 RepID=UPI003BEF4673